MDLIKHIPNGITCLNLISGCFGIIYAFEGNLKAASYMIFLACVFDFFDGFAARIFKVTSPIGKELDSLADMVTFGVLPGIILLKLSTIKFNLLETEGFSYLPFEWYGYGCFIIIVFSGLRLAKFNIDTRQSYGFIGVPTPANAIFIASLPFIYLDISFNSFLIPYLKYLPLFISLVMSSLLVSEIPLIAFKFKNFSIKDNLLKYSFLLVSLLLFIILKFLSIPIIILLYIIISLIETRKSSIPYVK